MKRFIATTALATLVASPVFAQSNQYNPAEGPYLGAGIGQAKVDNDTLDSLEQAGANTDDSDTATKLFAGYRFNPNFAVEASYLDFGDSTASASSGSDSANLKLGIDGFGAALVGRLPIQGGLSIHGKLGMIAWDADLSGSVFDNGQSYQASSSEDGTDPFYGVGAEYVIDRVMIRGEYERYDLSDSGEDFTIDLASVSLGYLF